MTQSQVIRFGVVGLGAISVRHCKIIEETPGAALTALCDPDPRRLAAAGRERPAAARFASLGELIRARACDAIVICAPSGLHGDLIEEAAAAGLHSLCEKPLEVTLARAESAWRACRRAGTRLGVVYQRRGLELFRRMAAEVAAGRLGPLALAGASIKWFRPASYYQGGTWHGDPELEGGGCLANQAVHPIDALLMVAGRIEAVSAHIATRAHPIRVEDTAVAALRFASGAIGTLEAATSSFPGEPMTFQFHGPRGTLSVANEKIQRWAVEGADQTESARREHEALPEYGDGWAGHRVILRDFAAAIREGREPLVGARAAWESVAVLEALYESARTGRETAVPAPPPDLLSCEPAS